MDAPYDHLLRKSQEAKRGGQEVWAVQSTGEKVAVALALNRADWLAEMDYSIAEVIDRSGPEWVAIIPQVARQLAEEDRTDDVDRNEAAPSIDLRNRGCCPADAAFDRHGNRPKCSGLDLPPIHPGHRP